VLIDDLADVSAGDRRGDRVGLGWDGGGLADGDGGGLADGAHARAHVRARVSAERDTLIEEATRALGAPPVSVRVRHELRYRGQSFELAVEEAIGTPLEPAASPVDADALLEAFGRAHEERYGYRGDATAVELVNIRVSAVGERPQLRSIAGAEPPPIAGRTEISFEGDPVEAVVLAGAPSPGTRISGPALCAFGESTLLVPPGWSGEVDGHGTIHMREAG
jgi:N-methylhydantoinase A